MNAPPELVTSLHFDDSKLHHVAAKCGVFAETDIVNLIKSGIPSNEVLCSLADAIVLQNLSVLTRGGTLKHRVLLLGGPNTYLPFLQECWRLRIPATWDERGYAYPQGHARSRSSSSSPRTRSTTRPSARCSTACTKRRRRRASSRASTACASTSPTGARPASARRRGRRSPRPTGELDEFRELYTMPKFVPTTFARGREGARGDRARRRLDLVARRCSSATTTARSSARPTSSPRATRSRTPRSSSAQLRAYVEEDQGAELEVMGFGATGYAADVLQECVRADVNIVETVAHMMSAVHFFGDVDVICDIGGQDIKVLFMKNGDIANFRLSNSCSAGNGMLLQATADSVRRAGHRVRRRGLQGRARAQVLVWVRRLPRHRPGELPEGGLLQGGDARRPRPGAAQERVAVRGADPAARRAGDEVRVAGWHAIQPRRGEGAGRLHQGARARRRGLRAPAHRRGRGDRRGDGRPCGS